MSRRLRFAVLTTSVMMVVLLMTAPMGCGSDASTSLVTVISRPVDMTWIPAQSPNSADEARLAGALRPHELHFLVPSTPPVADPLSVSAQFILWETVPTKEITLELVVKRGDDANPLIAVTSWVGDPPTGTGATESIRIRGQDGHARVAPGAVSMLEWVEGGQQYDAEWVGLPLDEMVTWLDAWRTIPGG